MSKTEKESFCVCFGCDKSIFVGESCHSITYSYDKIESSFLVHPTKAIALGSWCSDCFGKMLAKKECTLSLHDIHQ